MREADRQVGSGPASLKVGAEGEGESAGQNDGAQGSEGLSGGEVFHFVTDQRRSGDNGESRCGNGE